MKTISWLVPRLSYGSGGQRTILMHAHYLLLNGYNVCVYLDMSDASQSLSASELILKRFGYNFNFVDFGWEKISDCDITICTYWTSARFLFSKDINTKKCYFVQDYEPLFYAGGENYIQALSTYNYGFNHICIGNWLPSKLYKSHSVKSYKTEFCADLSIYFDQNLSTNESIKSVAVLYQPEKSRRCASFVLNSLQLISLWVPDLEIHIFGSNRRPYVNFKYIFHGLVSKNECSKIYNICDLGVCLSATNPSRIPFEMMACGLPVIDLYSENNLYDYSSESCLLANPDPIDIAASIYHMLYDNSALKKMSITSKKLMTFRDEIEESKQFESAILKIFSDNEDPITNLDQCYDRDKYIYDKNIHPSIPNNYRALSIETGALSKFHPVLAKIIRRIYRFFS